MTTIPLSKSTLQRFSLTLEEEKIDFTIRYVHLTDRWLMSLARDEVTILAGHRLVMGIDLLGPFNFKLGALFCFTADEPGKDPGRNDFESRVQIIHASEAEIAAVSS